MKQTYFVLILFLAAVTFSSCEKKLFSNLTEEEQVEGIWRYDRVKFNNGGLSNNITDDYHLSSIRFNADSTFTHYNHQTGLLTDGYWEIFRYDVWDPEDEDTDTEKELYLFFWDTTLNAYESHVWYNFDAQKKKLEAEEDWDGGTYDYRLERIGEY